MYKFHQPEIKKQFDCYTLPPYTIDVRRDKLWKLKRKTVVDRQREMRKIKDK